MAYPGQHKLRDAYLYSYCTSIGGTAVACYFRMPFRGTILKVAACAQGAITSADCTVAYALNGTANTAGNLTIPVASAAAGQVASATPTANLTFAEDDYVTLTPSGASGSSIACMFTLIIRDTQ